MIGFNRIKLRHAVTFMKYFTGVVPLIFLPKTLTWNIIKLLAPNLLNFPELVANELKRVSPNIFTNIHLSIRIISA